MSTRLYEQGYKSLELFFVQDIPSSTVLELTLVQSQGWVWDSRRSVGWQITHKTTRKVAKCPLQVKVPLNWTVAVVFYYEVVLYYSTVSTFSLSHHGLFTTWVSNYTCITHGQSRSRDPLWLLPSSLSSFLVLSPFALPLTLCESTQCTNARPRTGIGGTEGRGFKRQVDLFKFLLSETSLIIFGF